MVIDGEKVYLYNPFRMDEWTDEDLGKQMDILIKKYNADADGMFQFADNVENLANQCYIIGEMISRLNENCLVLKNRIDISRSKQVYVSRKQWQEVNTEKAPAMSYFEALASDFVKDDLDKYAKEKARLDRFKYAYDSLEQKQNALKKKMESIKYEEFGNN
jgi:outer membrane lipoprotein-sorting protein